MGVLSRTLRQKEESLQREEYLRATAEARLLVHQEQARGQHALAMHQVSQIAEKDEILDAQAKEITQLKNQLANQKAKSQENAGNLVHLTCRLAISQDRTDRVFEAWREANAKRKKELAIALRKVGDPRPLVRKENFHLPKTYLNLKEAPGTEAPSLSLTPELTWATEVNSQMYRQPDTPAAKAGYAQDLGAGALTPEDPEMTESDWI